MSLAMSASIHWIAWNSAIGLPNWRRAAWHSPIARLQRRLQDADGQRGDAHPPLVEHAHHHVKAAPLGAEQRVRPAARTSSKLQRADLRGALPHLVLLRPALHARPRRRSTMKMLHPAIARRRVGARQHQRDSRPPARCGSTACSPFRRQPSPSRVAVVRRPGEVGARLGLGERIGAAPLRPQQRPQLARRCCAGVPCCDSSVRDQLDQPALVGHRLHSRATSSSITAA